MIRNVFVLNRALGASQDYAAMLKETKALRCLKKAWREQEQRLQEILEETKRILADLGGSCADLEVEQPKALACFWRKDLGSGS